MSDFLQGATMLASLGVALFFLRFWRRTGDRFFAAFAAAFVVFAVNRLLLATLAEDSEARTWVYGLRAAAFLLIIAAILDKNYGRRAKPPASSADPQHPGAVDPRNRGES